MMVKAHFGSAIAGPFGAAATRRFDVIGKAVNAAAMLDSTGVALSADAFSQAEPGAAQALQEAHADDHVHPIRRPAPFSQPPLTRDLAHNRKEQAIRDV